MELSSFPLLALEGLHPKSCEINQDESRLTFHLSSRQTSARCPLCQTLTRRVHSRYRRILADLPCGIFQVVLKVRVGKFFCLNPECECRIFTERLPEVVAPHARKTVRLIQRLQALGLALGGEARARLAREIGTPASGSTILDHLQKLCLPEIGEIRSLGVDDFAFRKGRQYGTILVDLEKHRPLALLADRKAETLNDWLVGHPEIEVLSRDRSKTYAGAMTRGLPNAVQVADRFHLVQNLGETLEKVFSSYDRELRTLGQERRQTLELMGQVTVTPKPTASQGAYA